MSVITARYGLLRSPTFDTIFIFGSLLIAFLIALTIAEADDIYITSFFLVILSDTHAIATYSRIFSDKISFKKYYHFVSWTPVVVVLLALYVFTEFGLRAGLTTYFVLQWFHYTRQSYGISRAYLSKHKIPEAKWFTQAVIFAIPVWGLATRLQPDQPKFLIENLYHLPLSVGALNTIYVLALTIVVLWFLNQFNTWERGDFSLGYFLYMLSHFIVFYIAFVWFDNLTLGWVFVAAWHPIQYIFFLWHFQNEQFKDLKRKAFMFYFALYPIVFIGFFIVLAYATDVLRDVRPHTTMIAQIVPLGLFASLAFNFNHYLIDAVVWRRQK